MTATALTALDYYALPDQQRAQVDAWLWEVFGPDWPDLWLWRYEVIGEGQVRFWQFVKGRDRIDLATFDRCTDIAPPALAVGVPQ